MSSDESYTPLREALERIRLHGSPWWKPSWGNPARIANEALNAHDAYLAAEEDKWDEAAKATGG